MDKVGDDEELEDKELNDRELEDEMLDDEELDDAEPEPDSVHEKRSDENSLVLKLAIEFRV